MNITDDKNWSIAVWIEIEQVLLILKQLQLQDIYIKGPIPDVNINIPTALTTFEQIDPDVIKLITFLSDKQNRDFNIYDLYLHLSQIVFDKITAYISNIYAKIDFKTDITTILISNTMQLYNTINISICLLAMKNFCKNNRNKYNLIRLCNDYIDLNLDSILTREQQQIILNYLNTKDKGLVRILIGLCVLFGRQEPSITKSLNQWYCTDDMIKFLNSSKYELFIYIILQQV